MQRIAASLERAAYILAGARKEEAKIWRKTILLATGLFSVGASLLTLLLYIIIRGI
jgi:hypothetical protein